MTITPDFRQKAFPAHKGIVAGNIPFRSQAQNLALLGISVEIRFRGISGDIDAKIQHAVLSKEQAHAIGRAFLAHKNIFCPLDIGAIPATPSDGNGASTPFEEFVIAHIDVGLVGKIRMQGNIQQSCIATDHDFRWPAQHRLIQQLTINYPANGTGIFLGDQRTAIRQPGDAPGMIDPPGDHPHTDVHTFGGIVIKRTLPDRIDMQPVGALRCTLCRQQCGYWQYGEQTRHE